MDTSLYIKKKLSDKKISYILPYLLNSSEILPYYPTI